METIVRWAIWCPQGHKCGRKGRRMGPAPSEVQARERLLAPLAHAALDEEERIHLANTAEVACWEEEVEPEYEDGGRSAEGGPYEEEEAAELAPPPKRPRIAAPPSTPPTMGALVAAVKEGMKVAMAEAAAISTAVPKSAPSASASSSSFAPMVQFGGINLTRSQSMEILEHLHRAEQAARQCSKLCASASTAFLEEASAFAAAKASIRGIVERE